MAEGAAASLSESREMDEFQFLLCESCHGEIQSPKLLPCLHNLCTQCLVESQPNGHCAVCRAPYSSPELPCNVLFANLQAQRGIYQKFSQGGDLVCGCGSEREAVFWCPECDWLFCDGVCFTNHQKVKKNSPHEIKSLKDLQAMSSTEFFAGARKQSVMYCPKENHKNDPVRFYCNECRRPMCMICTVLDSKHKEQHCEMQDEVRRRQNELQSLQRELQKSNHSKAYESLQALVGDMEKVRNETRELIQRQFDEMVKVLKEKEAKFLAEVEDQHQRQVQDVERKLRDVEGLVQRMGSSEQLVEKMRLYASDQAVLEMHPYLKGSLEELRRNQPPVVSFQTQVRDFVEVQTQLQALFERVTKAREAVPGRLEAAPNQAHILKAPAKRNCAHIERAVQTPPKVVKMEHDGDRWLEQPGTSSQSPGCVHSIGSRDEAGEGMEGSVWPPRPAADVSEPDDAPLSISSGDEITDDESAESRLLQDIGNRSQSSQEEWDLQSGQGTLVFFDLKLLPGDILHLAALAEEANCFSVIIRPLVPSSAGDVRSKFCETGMETFLDYVCSLPLPILVGYNIWSFDHLPDLFSALRGINKEERFKASIFGFIDALPLIKEKTPQLASHTLKSLDSMYLWGQLNSTRADDCAKTLKDLCTVLEVNPVMEKTPVITYSNLQAYASLRPLLWEKLLSQPSAKTLALHNVCLSTLQHVYQEDPERGLSKLCRVLNRRRRDTEEKVQKLSKSRLYFQTLQSAAWPLQPLPRSKLH